MPRHAVILERMTIAGAFVTVDAIATNPVVAEVITDKGADCLLVVKRNQTSRHD